MSGVAPCAVAGAQAPQDAHAAARLLRVNIHADAGGARAKAQLLSDVRGVQNNAFGANAGQKKFGREVCLADESVMMPSDTHTRGLC
jgi:hypothetical protein